MARFPHYKRNVKALGKLIAKVATNEALMQSFRKDPKPFLEKLGLPEQTTELLSFRVVSECGTRKAITIPYRLNSEKLARRDPDYLAGLSNLFPQKQLN
ncbi:hypothetical protein [Roseibium sp.]|uniref:hypothetical protein n=1 Tax=Roseibium sp. TaxID=1936156 RepID=UPI003B512288